MIFSYVVQLFSLFNSNVSNFYLNASLRTLSSMKDDLRRAIWSSISNSENPEKKKNTKVSFTESSLVF